MNTADYPPYMWKIYERRAPPVPMNRPELPQAWSPTGPNRYVSPLSVSLPIASLDDFEQLCLRAEPLTAGSSAPEWKSSVRNRLRGRTAPGDRAYPRPEC